MTKMSVLNIMVGVAGVGKSTIVENKKNVISLDKIRLDLYGSLKEAKKYKNETQTVKRIAEKQIKQKLNEGQDVWYDATNLKRRLRKHIYDQVKNQGHDVILHIVLKPLNTLLKQNKQRNEDSKVPEKVIFDMYRGFTPPKVGLDCDRFFVYGNYEEFKTEILENINKPHDSPYHMETIKEHIDLCIENAKNPILKEVAKYHDLGKSVCRIENLDNKPAHNYFRTRNGIYCNYYGHENVSAMYYLSRFKSSEEMSEQERLILELIYHHMQKDGISNKTILKNNLTTQEIKYIILFNKIDDMSRVVDYELLEQFTKLKKGIKNV